MTYRRSLTTLSTSGLALCCWALILAMGSTAVLGQETTSQSSTEQPPAGFFTEAIDVRVINVDVFVTDRSGRPVAGLPRESFELKVDGEVVPISNFYAEAGGVAREAVGPIAERTDSTFMPEEAVAADATRRTYVVLLIDHTRLSAPNRKRAFNALRQAIGRLGETDLIAVVGIEAGLVFYSDFLYDRQAVERILDRVTDVRVPSAINEFERRQIFGELARGMSGGIQARASLADENMLMARIRAYAAEEYERSRTSLRLIQQVVNTLTGVPGRKAVLYVGEGIPNRPGEDLFVEWRNRFGQGNPQAGIGLRRIDFNTDYTREVGRYDVSAEIDQLAASANSAGVTLYAVDAEGDHGADVRSALTEQGATSETVSVLAENFREPLEGAAKATGGKLLLSSGMLVEQMVNLLGDFDTYYSLGFMPPADWEVGSSHQIDVKVEGRDLLVRHREDVRLPDRDELEAGATVAALRYQTADNPLGIRAVPADEATVVDGLASLPVRLEIPVGSIGFVPTGDVHAGSLTLYVSTMNAQGETSQVQKIPFHLDIPADKLEQAQSEAAHYPLPLVLRPGDRYAAIGVRDDVNDVFSAIRLDLSSYSDF